MPVAARILDVNVPEVNPSGAPGTRGLSVRANPDMFGGAIASGEERLGQGATRAGEAGLDVATFQARLDDELFANDAMVPAMQRMTNAWSGLQTKEGNAAVAAHPQFQQDMEGIYKEAIAAAPNAYSKALLSRNARYMADYYLRAGQSYVDQQRKTWADKSAIDAANEFHNQAILSINDPKHLDVMLNSSDDQVRKLYEQRYANPDNLTETRNEIEAKVKENRGIGVSRIVKYLIDQGDAQHAAAVYEKYKGQIDSKAQVTIAGALRAPLNDQRAAILKDFLLRRQNPGVPQGFTPALMDAVIHQESGGHAGVVSPKGALGLTQLMPATAREMALQMGLPYDEKALLSNPDYNRALGTQYLQNLLNRYGGNQTLALAAYNAGPGRVDQWIRQYGDPRSGTVTDAAWAQKIPIGETRDYVAAITRRLGTNPNGALPDKSATYQLAVELTRGNEPLRNKVLTSLAHEYSIQSTMDATERAQLTQEIPDIIRAAEAGVQGLSIPEDRIRAVFPAPKAQQMIDEFTIAGRVGDVLRGTQWATPAELASAQHDIESGQGVLSTQIRAHRGGAVGPGTAGAEPGQDSGMYFRLRAGAAAQLDRMVTRRDAMLSGANADPAAYVSTHPSVTQAKKTLEVAPNDPAAYRAYASAELAVQDHLGVRPDEQRILPRAEAERLAARWAHPELIKPDKQGEASGAQAVYGEIAAQAHLWGDYWPQVYREISPKLDPMLRVIAAGVPQAAGVALINAQHQTEADLLKGQPSTSSPEKLSQSVQKQLAPFAATLSGAGRTGALTDYQKTTSKLAAVYMTSGAGMDLDAAAQKAANDLILDKYDFSGGTFRVPRFDAQGQPFPYSADTISEGAAAAKAQLGTSSYDNNLEAADKALKLTPQERKLYDYHLGNLGGSGKVVNADHSISTIKDITVESQGKTYVIPTVSGGKLLSNEEAWDKAKTHLSDFPSYASEKEASDRYDAIHKFMDQDVGAYRNRLDLSVASKAADQPGVSSDYLQQETVKALRDNGVWMTSPKEDGLVLMQPDGFAARRADGSPLILTWQQLGTLAKGRSSAAGQPVMAVGVM